MSVYDHCPQCRARLQRAAHKDIYRPASRTRPAETRRLGRIFFKRLARRPEKPYRTKVAQKKVG